MFIFDFVFSYSATRSPMTRFGQQTLMIFLSFCVSAGVTSHQWAARCSFALWESFYTPSDAALTLGGGVPP